MHAGPSYVKDINSCVVRVQEFMGTTQELALAQTAASSFGWGLLATTKYGELNSILLGKVLRH